MTVKRKPTRRPATRGRSHGGAHVDPIRILVASLAVVAAAIFFLPLLERMGVDVAPLMAMIWQPGDAQAAQPVEGTAEVHFIDVGQASSILIRGSQKTALIDGGEPGDAAAILRYLEKTGVEKLDYFFNTHPHADHLGGCVEILKKMPTDEFIMTPLPEKLIPTTGGYKRLIEHLLSHKESITTRQSAVGDQFELGGGLTLTTLGPVSEYDNLNDQSIVTRMEFGKTSFLFTGDMEDVAERDLLAAGALQPVTVLSAPHHGSNSSIDRDFLQQLCGSTPPIAVISCGVGNDYGHPHKETLSIYDELGISYYRTDRQGSIRILSDGDSLTVTTERD
ncbi:MAG: ComEC/Rec2 family competence protein [Angelakisella sp.]